MCISHYRVHWINWIVQLDFRAAFGSATHQLIHLKHSSVGVGGSVLTQFSLIDCCRSGCRSKLINVVSGVTQGSILAPQLFRLKFVKLFSIQNTLYGNAAFTLVAVVPFPGDRLGVVESLNRDINTVSEWCDLWRIKLNASKTKTIVWAILISGQHHYLWMELC